MDRVCGEIGMITVVIPTYNEETNIEETLKHVINQNIPRSKYEVIIVDGGSKDKTVKLAKRYANRVIQQKSKGVGGARNDGVAVAKYPIVATTDADVIVPTDWLSKILDHFKDPNVIAVCGSDFPREQNGKAIVVFKSIQTIIRLFSKLGKYPFFGTNTAFRKDVFLGIGGYSHLPYMDDVELGTRISKCPGKIIFDRKISVLSSTRRFEKCGYLNLVLLWLQGHIRLMLSKPLIPRNYSKQNY
ncbi:MAG: glycosyltransferase family 2 protein [Candidatus Aenigmatarchaeota archaeon]